MTITAAAKSYLEAAFVRAGIPYGQATNAAARLASLGLDTGNTSHDTAVTVGAKFGWAGDFSAITGGTFDVIIGSNEPVTFDFDDSAATILDALDNIDAGLAAGAGTLVGGDLLFTFDTAYLAAPKYRLDPTNLLSGTSEVQTVVIDATGGSFTLTFDGETTAAIPANSTAVVVRSALEALANIGTGNVAVVRSGSANAYTYTVTFQGDLAYTSVPEMTGDDASLTGGAHSVTNDTTTEGVDGNGPASGGWLTEADTLPYTVPRVLGAVADVDSLLNSIGFPSVGATEATRWLEQSRLTGTVVAKHYPPVAAQTSTKYLKNA